MIKGLRDMWKVPNQVLVRWDKMYIESNNHKFADHTQKKKDNFFCGISSCSIFFCH